MAELGETITADYADRPPLLVGVLKGAFVFLADLARAIRLPLELDFMAVSSYGTATKTSGVVRIVKDLDIDLTGRHVLIVEDILDSGLTLSYLRKSLHGPWPGEPCGLLAPRQAKPAAKVRTSRSPTSASRSSPSSSSATGSTLPSATATCPICASTSPASRSDDVATPDTDRR